MKAFITGVTGMIGSHIARVLVERGDEVHGLVRWRSNLRNLSGILGSIRTHCGDLQDGRQIRQIVNDEIRPDVIFHFAAQAYNGVSWDCPGYTLSVNILGTLNILEALRDAGNQSTRVLLAGSSTEYGATTETWEGPIPETAPFRPVTPYGVSKVATELLGFQYMHSHGIPVVVVRPFNQAGTGHTESVAIQEFCRQVAMIEAGLQEPVLHVGPLTALRDCTDIRDSAPVLVRLAEIGVPGEAYNLASGVAVSVKEMLDIALELATVDIRVETDPSRFRPYDEKVLLGDNTKLRELTGWTPAPDLRRSIQDILEYWRTEIGLRYPREG